MMCWTKEELMIAAAADVIKDHDIALVGIGLPNPCCYAGKTDACTKFEADI